MRTHFREEPFFGGLIVYVVVRVLMRGFYYLADLARKEDISETSIDTFPGRR